MLLWQISLVHSLVTFCSGSSFDNTLHIQLAPLLDVKCNWKGCGPFDNTRKTLLHSFRTESHNSLQWSRRENIVLYTFYTASRSYCNQGCTLPNEVLVLCWDPLKLVPLIIFSHEPMLHYNDTKNKFYNQCHLNRTTRVWSHDSKWSLQIDYYCYIVLKSPLSSQIQ